MVVYTRDTGKITIKNICPKCGCEMIQECENGTCYLPYCPKCNPSGGRQSNTFVP